MSNFLTALIKQRNDAKKSDTSAGRLKEIISIINKYDYDNGITPEIVVSILEDLGPTFVKLGQIASQQSDSIPPEYCDALISLRSNVAPMELDEVNAQIEKYLGAPTDEVFASFDPKPLGSASIAQVHKATLQDGTVVAVKVRRPGVVDTVARDFALMEKALNLNDKLARGKTLGFDLKSMVKELETTSKMELDFTNEANNLNRFWENNQDRDYVTSPKCYQDYTNEAILTEDFAEGKEAGDTSFMASLSDEDRERLAKLVADNFASQILSDGFYHADPHSGNVLVQRVPVVKPAVEDEESVEDVEAAAADIEAAAADAATASEAAAADAEPVEEELTYGINWIDFGMMGTLTAKQRQILLDLVSSLLKQDPYAMKKIVLQIAVPEGEIDHGAMLDMCETMCAQSNGTDLGDFSLGDLLSMILGGLAEENYKVDPFLTNLARGIIAAEGTVRTIDPNANIMNSFLEQVNLAPSLESFDLDQTLKTLLMKYLQSADSNTLLPTKAVQTLDMLEKGQITVHSGLKLEEKSVKTLEHITNNAIYAALSIALFIGSTIMCLIPGATHTVEGIPAIGFSGFVLGLIFMWLTYRKVNKSE